MEVSFFHAVQSAVAPGLSPRVLDGPETVGTTFIFLQLRFQICRKL